LTKRNSPPRLPERKLRFAASKLRSSGNAAKCKTRSPSCRRRLPSRQRSWNARMKSWRHCKRRLTPRLVYTGLSVMISVAPHSTCEMTAGNAICSTPERIQCCHAEVAPRTSRCSGSCRGRQSQRFCHYKVDTSRSDMLQQFPLSLCIMSVFAVPQCIIFQ